MTEVPTRAEVWQKVIREYTGPEVTWHAAHDECGWSEELTAWHNAFWAADHHMRYDCGRREPSSGGYETFEQGQARMRAHLVDVERGGPYDSWVPELYSLNEGGVQKDPTPTPTEGPTVELGAITAELGPVPGPLVGVQWEGSTGDTGAGSAGWWARVRGKRHAR